MPLPKTSRIVTQNTVPSWNQFGSSRSSRDEQKKTEFPPSPSNSIFHRRLRASPSPGYSSSCRATARQEACPAEPAAGQSLCADRAASPDAWCDTTDASVYNSSTSTHYDRYGAYVPCHYPFKFWSYSERPAATKSQTLAQRAAGRTGYH